MGLKNRLFLIFLILMVLLSVSVVCATENTTVEQTDELAPLSAIQTPIDQSPELDDFGTEDSMDVNESTDGQHQNNVLKASNTGETPLRAPSEVHVVQDGYAPAEGYTWTPVWRAIQAVADGGCVYLDGATYTRDSAINFIINKNITLYGGSSKNDTSMAIMDNNNLNNNVADELIRMRVYNIKFMNYIATGGDCLFFRQSTAYNCIFDNFNGLNHCLHFGGSNPFSLCAYNCTFSNSKVTFGGRDADSGQYMTIANAIMDKCNFINLTSQHHSAALCISPLSGITNCNFTNLSAWIGAAMYVHGFNDNPATDPKTYVENCTFTNCSATECGGAIATNYNYLQIKNCYFYNNSAPKGAAIMVGGINHPKALVGNNLAGHYINISDCYFEGNEGTIEGGAVHITGTDANIDNSIFINNTAKNGNGAAIYIEGPRSTITNSQFYNHTSNQGTIYIDGINARVSDSTFENNTATNGAGVFIKGASAVIENNNFTNNNATGKGGACYIEGDYSRFTGNDFTYNNAIPQANNDDVGLGGAVYVKGSNTNSNSNSFEFNTARNGSAVYTDGSNFNLVNDKFFKNQAFSYFLVTTAEPEDSIHKTSDVLVTIVHVGGDNILNAIHNTRPFSQIKFQNVTYIDFYGNLTSTGLGMTTPLDGPLNSNNGTHVYQYDREAYQDVHIVITHEDSTVRYDDTLKTDIDGTVTLNLDKLSLKPGNYSVYAEHPEDWNYKFIMNTTSFRINAIPVTPGKTVSNPTPDYGDIITYNLTVINTVDVVYSDNIYFRRYENV